MSRAYVLYQLLLARKTPKRYTITRLRSMKSSIYDNQHLESHLLTYSWPMQFTKQGLLVPLHSRLVEASEWSKDSPIKKELQWGDMSHEVTKTWVTIWKAAQSRKEWKQLPAEEVQRAFLPTAITWPLRRNYESKRTLRLCTIPEWGNTTLFRIRMENS